MNDREWVIDVCGQITQRALNALTDELESRGNRISSLRELLRVNALELAASNAQLLKVEADAARLRAAGQAMYDILRELHYGRMPEAVQKAFDGLASALTQEGTDAR